MVVPPYGASYRGSSGGEGAEFADPGLAVDEKAHAHGFRERDRRHVPIHDGDDAHDARGHVEHAAVVL